MSALGCATLGATAQQQVRMDALRYPGLSKLSNPLELQGMSAEQLEVLAQESRDFLIESISRTGGHLGAALGVVELTVALFHHFDFLRDRIAWDVGHQAHVYKLLTGRAPLFAQYGQWGGLCKFLERRESPYDHMGAGHASTSVSAALGMAVARDLRGEPHHVMAVIGDGAMTGGLAYEALSMAGHLDLNLLVVLNDNGMSIDANVGAFSAFSRTVTRITTSDSYNALRNEVKKVSGRVPFGSEILRGLKHMERSVKDYASPHAGFFESLGFHYFGPVSGHDLRKLMSTLAHIKTMRGPILLHVSTVKGKGLGEAVEGTFEAHAVSPAKAAPTASTSQKATGVQPAARKSWTQIYTEGMQDVMARDPAVVALTAAMMSNTGLAPLKERYPDRVLDTGIAEANAYCSAAGMAIGGLKPFVTVYSTFSQRAFDQLIHDIALQSLPVRIMMDRGGFVGNDGPTHHGVFDHSYLRLIPGLVHMAPRDEREMRRMLLTALAHQDGPIAMRYPRGDTPVQEIGAALDPIPVGQGELLHASTQPGLFIAAVGSMVVTALQVADALEAEGIPVAVADARFIKPLDEALLGEQIARAKAVLTLEENVLAGGFGEGVLALMAQRGLAKPIRLLGAPDRFISFGSQQDQLRESGLTPPQVIETARDLWNSVSGSPARLRRVKG
jgi:1-deoxy-D-xylulose-5-phosphate synthase